MRIATWNLQRLEKRKNQLILDKLIDIDADILVLTTRHQTYDRFTTVCTDIKTPFGALTVYGSIIGVLGNRQPRFNNDLNGQLEDFMTIFPGRKVCLAGDLNVTFSGRPWPNNKARQALVDAFNVLELTNTTSNIKDTVDHIVLSTDFINDKHLEIETWNEDKKLSDHVGHVLTLTE